MAEYKSDEKVTSCVLQHKTIAQLVNTYSGLEEALQK